MVLIPQETLQKLQSARRLEQTPTTRVVHSLDAEMRELLERENLSDDDKIKLYHQTLQRYINLNKQRSAPLAMTLESKKVENQPSKLQPMTPGPPKLEREIAFDDSSKIHAYLRDDPEEEESYHFPKLFAEAPHLKATPKTKKTKTLASTRTPRSRSKWTPY